MGPLEILIVIVIAIVVFGGYKKLPQLGRSAGANARIGTEKAKELADTVGDKVGDRFDPESMGRSAGKGMREARDFRDSFKGTLDPPAKTQDSKPTQPAPKDVPPVPSPSAGETETADRPPPTDD